MDEVFTQCYVEAVDDKWFVVSKYWRLPCVDHSTACRIQEIISGAYHAGKLDAINGIRSALRLNPIDLFSDNWG